MTVGNEIILYLYFVSPLFLFSEERRIETKKKRERNIITVEKGFFLVFLSILLLFFPFSIHIHIHIWRIHIHIDRIHIIRYELI